MAISPTTARAPSTTTLGGASPAPASAAAHTRPGIATFVNRHWSYVAPLAGAALLGGLGLLVAGPVGGIAGALIGLVAGGLMSFGG